MDTLFTVVYIFLMLTMFISPSKGDDLEIFPAHIFGPSKVTVGENVMLKCRVFNNLRSDKEVQVYLCKNGVGQRLELLENRNDLIFSLRNISLRDSGNYSCVYSFTKYAPKKVTGWGLNSIHVQVTEIFPAQIFGPSTAKVGEDLAIRCSIANSQSSDTEVYMYLCKNGVVQRTEQIKTKDEHIFTLRNISLRDSGNYSCVYSFTRYFPKNVTGWGMNLIHVQVTDPTYEVTVTETYDPVLERNIVRLVFSIVVIISACFIVIFDFKTRSHSSSEFTSSVEAEDKNDS